ncbi:hypothetical protein HMPREF9540_01375 [Escherichia coli MS 115-1]|nr:hypothetical protein HMPREF9540_01375 [Escherichia coli MS 115-1]
MLKIFYIFTLIMGFKLLKLINIHSKKQLGYSLAINDYIVINHILYRLFQAVLCLIMQAVNSLYI